MSAIAACSSDRWQDGFVSDLPTTRRQFCQCFRRLPAARGEKYGAGAIAAACVSYRLLAGRGRL